MGIFRRHSALGGPSGSGAGKRVEKLVRGLWHSSKEHREQAALDLVDLGGEGVRALIAAIRTVDAKRGRTNEADRHARRTAELALWRVKDAASLGLLTEILDRGDELNELELISSALQAVGFIGDVQGVPALVAILDRDSSLKPSACWALGRIGGSEAVTALRRTLEDKENPRSQVAALKALEELGVGPQEEGGLGDVRRRAAIKDVFDAWPSGSSLGSCESCGVELLTRIVKAVPATLIVEFQKRGFHFSRSGIAITMEVRTLVTLDMDAVKAGQALLKVTLCEDCAWDVATFAVDSGST